MANRHFWGHSIALEERDGSVTGQIFGMRGPAKIPFMGTPEHHLSPSLPWDQQELQVLLPLRNSVPLDELG